MMTSKVIHHHHHGHIKINANTITISSSSNLVPKLHKLSKKSSIKHDLRIYAKDPMQHRPFQDSPGGRFKGGREWLQQLLSKFGPITDKLENTFVLDFEKPLVNLDNRIKEVRKVAEENGVDVSEQIAVLEQRAIQLRKDTYNKLTPNQRLQVARHPNRPTCLDIVMNITDRFIELHGDRAGLDDKAIVAGLGSIDEVTYMFIGHQKGRNTKENIERNFGMAQPGGFRKALRFMRYANKFGFPIVTFVDTPGAFAGVQAEELGQGEAIAVNLREMFSFHVPIISIVIGEGGSGGALAINCANKVLMLENSVYYVASPEACAAILWKSRDKAPEAARALKITAKDLIELGAIDEIIPEPLGGAHSDPAMSFKEIKKRIIKWFEYYKDMNLEDIRLDRHNRYRKFGVFSEHLVYGGNIEENEKRRKNEKGIFTKAGTWCLDDDEKEYVEEVVDRMESWDKTMEEKGKEWTRVPKESKARFGETQEVVDLAEAAVARRRQRQKEVKKEVEKELESNDDDDDDELQHDMKDNGALDLKNANTSI